MNQSEGETGDEGVKKLIREIIRSDPDLDGLFPDKRQRLAETAFCSIRRELGILDPLVRDNTISEIMVNGVDSVFVERKGKIEKVPIAFRNPGEIEEIARRMAYTVHREINELNPILDARMEDGSRFHCVHRNIAIGGPVLNIRKFPENSFTAEELVDNGTLTREAMDFLKAAVEGGLNIFVSGGTSSGKTTLLNVLSDFIPKGERIVVIEDSAELNLRHMENLVRMEVKEANSREKGEVSIADLVRSSLRMRPDRLVVGEVRGKEVVDMIQAMNTGHDGSLSTGHGNSPEGMLYRLEAMYLSAIPIPIQAVRRQISTAIDLIVHTGRMKDGTRRVLKIVEIAGLKGDEYRINEIFQYKLNESVQTSCSCYYREDAHRNGYIEKGEKVFGHY